QDVVLEQCGRLNCGKRLLYMSPQVFRRLAVGAIQRMHALCRSSERSKQDDMLDLCVRIKRRQESPIVITFSKCFHMRGACQLRRNIMPTVLIPTILQ